MYTNTESFSTNGRFTAFKHNAKDPRLQTHYIVAGMGGRSPNSPGSMRRPVTVGVPVPLAGVDAGTKGTVVHRCALGVCYQSHFYATASCPSSPRCHPPLPRRRHRRLHCSGPRMRTDWYCIWAGYAAARNVL